MNDVEKTLFQELTSQGIELASPNWESCRSWLRERDWKVNLLSDYPGGEVRFTVRQGFQRIEIMGHSDLEVIGKAVLEVDRRNKIDQNSQTATTEE